MKKHWLVLTTVGISLLLCLPFQSRAHAARKIIRYGSLIQKPRLATEASSTPDVEEQQTEDDVTPENKPAGKTSDYPSFPSASQRLACPHYLAHTLSGRPSPRYLLLCIFRI